MKSVGKLACTPHSLILILLPMLGGGKTLSLHNLSDVSDALARNLNNVQHQLFAKSAAHNPKNNRNLQKVFDHYDKNQYSSVDLITAFYKLKTLKALNFHPIMFLVTEMYTCTYAHIYASVCRV